MPPVKIDGIIGKQSFHQNGDGDVSGSKEKVKVTGDQGPCIACCLCFYQQIAEPPHKSHIILFIGKYLIAINAPHHVYA